MILLEIGGMDSSKDLGEGSEEEEEDLSGEIENRQDMHSEVGKSERSEGSVRPLTEITRDPLLTFIESG
jgi:hypothetical protein